MKITNIDLSLFLSRIILGLCIIMHGINEILHGIYPIRNLVIENKIPEFLAYSVYIGHFIAPIFLILGIYTRISSLVILIVSIFLLYLKFGLNIFIVLSHNGFNAELYFLYIALTLSIIFAGSGKYAIKKS